MHPRCYAFPQKYHQDPQKEGKEDPLGKARACSFSSSSPFLHVCHVLCFLVLLFYGTQNNEPCTCNLRLETLPAVSTTTHHRHITYLGPAIISSEFYPPVKRYYYDHDAIEVLVCSGWGGGGFTNQHSYCCCCCFLPSRLLGLLPAGMNTALPCKI